MTERQFLWGLSGGVSVFALAGTFWFGLGMSSVLTPATAWWVWTLSSILQFGACVALLWAALRMRRRSHFSTSEFRSGDEKQRAEARRLRTRFGWTTAGQTVLIGIGVWWCVRTNEVAFIWPWIGLIVSLHLVPLASLFHVRAYYVAALAGSVISLIPYTGIVSPYQVAWLGGGLSAVMWCTATYLVWKANEIAAAAAKEPWAV